MPTIQLRENEPLDIAIRRFRRSCEKAGILMEIRAREFYEKPTTVRRHKTILAKKRQSRHTFKIRSKRTRLY
ncbi:MAG: 30S ribosomal protein S21 [Chromatiales bacterium]|nr:30S ribosomal protein S21 [Chromatiales bacterium]